MLRYPGVGPNKVIDGMFKAQAICVGPVSDPITRSTCAINDSKVSKDSFIISSEKCYSGVSHHTTVYWRSTEDWETSVDDWIPLTPNIYNTNQTSVDLISLLNSITSDGYLCLAFSQSGVDGPPHLQNTHAYWRIKDLQINIMIKSKLNNQRALLNSQF